MRILAILLGLSCSLAFADVNDYIKQVKKQKKEILSTYSKQDLNYIVDKATHKSQAYAQLAKDLGRSAYENNPYINGQDKPKLPEDGVIIFASFSMSTDNIHQLLQASYKYQIPVVIRGFVNGSLPKTEKMLMKAMHYGKNDQSKVGVAINPLWFREFNIKAVPAFVSFHRPLDCMNPDEVCKGERYDIVKGNIPVASALDILATRGKDAPKGAVQALARGKNNEETKH